MSSKAIRSMIKPDECAKSGGNQKDSEIGLTLNSVIAFRIINECVVGGRDVLATGAVIEKL
jgi:hypothetical protein